VLGIEVSRLARTNADWYQLLDLCAITDTLIADADGVYHPADFNDRLVLGLKGTMSEAELHLIRSRLTAGLKLNAAKGELRQGLPVGRDYDEDDKVVLCADEAVREGSSLVFRRFDELGSARQVLIRLRGDGVLLRRVRGPTTTLRERKQLIRAVINEIAITVDADERVAELRILWQGDAATEVSMPTLSTSDSSDSETGPGGGDLVRFLVGAVLPGGRREGGCPDGPWLSHRVNN
jgi:Resolvase, N terminal domain